MSEDDQIIEAAREATEEANADLTVLVGGAAYPVTLAKIQTLLDAGSIAAGDVAWQFYAVDDAATPESLGVGNSPASLP